MRYQWHKKVFDQNGNELKEVIRNWVPNFDMDKLADIGVALLITCLAAPAGWYAHALLWRPDYSALTAMLKQKGYTVLAETIFENNHLCANGPDRMPRACEVLWTAQDLQAKAVHDDKNEKVAQARINTPN